MFNVWFARYSLFEHENAHRCAEHEEVHNSACFPERPALPLAGVEVDFKNPLAPPLPRMSWVPTSRPQSDGCHAATPALQEREQTVSHVFVGSTVRIPSENA